MVFCLLDLVRVYERSSGTDTAYSVSEFGVIRIGLPIAHFVKVQIHYGFVTATYHRNLVKFLLPLLGLSWGY